MDFKALEKQLMELAEEMGGKEFVEELLNGALKASSLKSLKTIKYPRTRKLTHSPSITAYS